MDKLGPTNGCIFFLPCLGGQAEREMIHTRLRLQTQLVIVSELLGPQLAYGPLISNATAFFLVLPFAQTLRLPAAPSRRSAPPQCAATMYRLLSTAAGAVDKRVSSASPSPSRPRSRQRSLADGLFPRIVAVRSTNQLAPVLEGWVREGRTVEKTVIQSIVKKLIGLRRYAQALEVPAKHFLFPTLLISN